MEEEDEVERFEVTDHDLETEFNPNRYRRRQTKMQSIFGKYETKSKQNSLNSKFPLLFCKQ
jgi:tuftelin-interacting protein 11